MSLATQAILTLIFIIIGFAVFYYLHNKELL